MPVVGLQDPELREVIPPKRATESQRWRQPKLKPGKPSSNGGNGINKGFGTDKEQGKA